VFVIIRFFVFVGISLLGTMWVSQAVAQTNDRKAEELLNQGAQAIFAKDYPSAVTLLKSGLELSPKTNVQESFNYRIFLAEAARETQQWEISAKAFEDAFTIIKTVPLEDRKSYKPREHVQMLEKLAFVNDKLNKPRKNVPLYNEILKIKKLFVEQMEVDAVFELAHHKQNFAQLYIRLNRIDKAEIMINDTVQVFERLLPKSPEFANALTIQAEIYHAKGHDTQAKAILDRAQSINDAFFKKNAASAKTCCSDLTKNPKAKPIRMGFEQLFLSIPEDAFYNGAETLPVTERKALLREEESATYMIATYKKNGLVIKNKFAKDSVYQAIYYLSDNNSYICVHTHYGQNDIVECWTEQGKVDLFTPATLKDFLKHPENFSDEVMAKETVQMSIDSDLILRANVNTWMNDAVTDNDLGYAVTYTWSPDNDGNFQMSKKPKN